MSKESIHWLRAICENYQAGKDIYNMLAETLKESPGAELIVSPANLGDTVFIASLAEAYKKAHNIKTLLIVAKERQAEAVKWFNGVDAVVGLSDDEIIRLRYYFTISENFYSNGIRYGHVPCEFLLEYPGVFFHASPGFGGDTLMHVWEERILDIPKDSKTSDLVVPPGIKAPSENVSKYENAVLIAPAAFTNHGIPESFWEKLTAALLEKGYEVYNNTGGLAYDKIIKGTKVFDATTVELILNAPLFKHVVSVRSGFTDLVSKTDAPLTVLHQTKDSNVDMRIEYGSCIDDIRDLGRMEDIYPFYYISEKENELIEAIMENI